MKCHTETASEEKKKNLETGSQLLGWPRRSLLSPWCVCSLQAHCEFGAAAAAFALFPSAVAPHRLLKNRLWSKQVPETGLSSPS